MFRNLLKIFYLFNRKHFQINGNYFFGNIDLISFYASKGLYFINKSVRLPRVVFSISPKNIFYYFTDDQENYTSLTREISPQAYLN